MIRDRRFVRQQQSGYRRRCRWKLASLLLPSLEAVVLICPLGAAAGTAAKTTANARMTPNPPHYYHRRHRHRHRLPPTHPRRRPQAGAEPWRTQRSPI